MSAAAWVGVAVLGGLGAVLRVVATRRPGGLAAVNLAGAALAGVLAGAAPGPEVLVVAGGGLLGALTTFSAWMLEVHRDPDPRHAAVRLVAPLVLGLVVAALGLAVGRAL